MIKKMQDQVRQFMLKAQQECPTSPTLPTQEVFNLRKKLHYEEAIIELQHAYDQKDIVALYDSLIDSLVVVIGTAVACGLDLSEGWEEVHLSNMAKFGPGGYKREDGKWMKPPNWEPPNLKAIVWKQMLTAPSPPSPHSPSCAGDSPSSSS